MTKFTISIVNSDFCSSSISEKLGLEAVRTEAVRGALELGTEEVCNGTPFFGAEVRIMDGARVIERMLVAIGVSPLQ